MNKQRAVARLAGIFLLLLFSTPDAADVVRAQGKKSGARDSRKSMVGNIKDDRAIEGCGCYFSHPSEDKKRFPRYLFFADIDEENGLMNIDGRDVRLKLVRSTKPRGRERIGSRLTRTYTADGIQVSVVYVTTRLCKPNDENCESTDYDATFTVTSSGRKETLRLKGGCGC